MTKTQEDLYFQIAVTGLSYNDKKPNFTVDIDGRDTVTYQFDKRNKQTMEFTFPAKSSAQPVKVCEPSTRDVKLL